MAEDAVVIALEGDVIVALDGDWHDDGSLRAVPPRIVNKRAPTDTDASVGRRIRDCRMALGLSLSELSGRVGVSQPQLYRYECGLTRVAASRLIAIAGALDVSIGALARPQDGTTNEPGSTAEIDLLLRAFSNIGQPERRSALIALARSMADRQAA